MRAASLALPMLLLVISPACDIPTTPPSPAPQLNFLNGPDELPNVIRYEQGFAASILDPVSGLRAFAGLPAVPGSFVGCQVFGPPFTGTEQFQLHASQLIGDEPPFVYLVNSNDVNVHVYRNVGFIGFCRSTVYAQGTGKLTMNDNDLTFSGERWNVWGGHIRGTVTIIGTGERAHLNAVVKFRARQGEPLEILVRNVELN